MPTIAEEDPAYPEKVAAYLKRIGWRRLPWGSIVAGGSLTYQTTSHDRARRAELGETAVRVLFALGVTPEELAALDELPENTPPSDLVLALELLRTPEPAAAPVCGCPDPDAEACHSARVGRNSPEGDPFHDGERCGCQCHALK